MDLSLILPLLAALVPLALFFLLVHRRNAPSAPPAETVSKPAPDFGLDRDIAADGAPETHDAGSPSAAASAAAAGGAFLLGYRALQHGKAGSDNTPDGEGDAHGEGSPDHHPSSRS